MPTAHIYQRPKSSMSSGRARSDSWVLEYAPSDKVVPDPLTGWAGSADTHKQLRLNFPTREAAVAYAKREGVAYTLVPAPLKTLKLQAYADNFR